MKGRISSLKASCLILVIVLTFVFSTQVFAGKPGGGGTASFGITAPKTKIGDAGFNGYMPIYGAGEHNMVVLGSEVYAAFISKNAYNEMEARIAVSQDSGLTWVGSEVVAHNTNIDGNGAAIAVTSPGDPIHVAWGERGGNGAIMYSHSTGGGITYGHTWSTPQVVSGSTIPIAFARSMAADGLGRIHIVFGASDGIYYSRSSDGGATFDEIATFIAPTVNDAEPSIAADAAGNVYAAWNYYGHVYFSKRLVGSSYWTTPIAVDGTIGGNYPSIAVYDSNRIYISWRITGAYIAVTSNGGGSWAQYVVTTQSAQTGDTSIAVDRNGILGIAWGGGTTGGAYFQRSGDGGKTWSTPVLVDSQGGRFPNIAVDGNGKACMMFQDTHRSAVYFTKEK